MLKKFFMGINKCVSLTTFYLLIFQAADTKPTFVEKPVKGDKNGGKRMVRVKRLRSDVPTYVR